MPLTSGEPSDRRGRWRDERGRDSGERECGEREKCEEEEEKRRRRKMGLLCLNLFPSNDRSFAYQRSQPQLNQTTSRLL